MGSNNLTLMPAAPQVAAPAIDYSKREVIETLKQTVAKGATDAELALFVEHCKGTGLNPFKREVWFIKTQNGVQIMTGINGFYEIANRHPQFDGLEVEAVEDAGVLIKAIARCYRKDRSRPTVAEAYLAEYGKQYGNWKTMPRLMLSKCAESMALRKSFPQELNGLYTVEEMPAEFAAPPAQTTTPAPEPAPAPEAQPEPAPAKKQARHWYNIQVIPAEGEKNRTAAKELLEKAGAIKHDLFGYIWESPRKIKFPAECEVSAEEAARLASESWGDANRDHAKDSAGTIIGGAYAQAVAGDRDYGAPKLSKW